MAVVAFPSSVSGDVCAACGDATSTHRVGGVWLGCRRDIVIGRDQETLARRLRLSRLQSRVVTVRPFGIDAEGMETR